MKLIALVFLLLLLFSCGGSSSGKLPQRSDSANDFSSTPSTTPSTSPNSDTGSQANEPVIASAFDDGSSNINYPPANVIDADMRFESRWAASGSPVSLTIQLQELALISEFGIAWGRGDSRKFTFEIYTRADSNSDWILAYDNISSGTSDDIEYYDIIDIEAQQILIKTHANSIGTAWIDIIEVDVKGPREGSDDEGSDEGLSAEELDVVDGDPMATASIDSKGGYYIDVIFKTVAGSAVKLDVYLPEFINDSPVPVMIYSHGGGWRTGDKTYVGSGSRGVVSDAMLEAGVAVVSVDYRLSGDGVISYQDIIRDMKDACRFITKYAHFYNIDPNRMLTFGDSAGAHIAMMTGLASNTDENFIEAEDLRHYNNFKIIGIAAWYGPVSFMEEHSSFFTDGGRNPKSLNAMAYPASVTDTEIQAQMRAIASPINYYTNDSPPLYLAHGDMDTTIPYYHLLGMRDYAQSESINTFSYTIAENAGHSFGSAIDGVDVVPSPTEIREETIQKLRSFLSVE